MRLSKQHIRPFLALSVVVFCGCDRLAPQRAEDAKYELRQDEKGRLVRLNKVTGEVTLLTDGKAIPVLRPDPEAPSSRPSSNAASITKQTVQEVKRASSSTTSGVSTMVTSSVTRPSERATAVRSANATEPPAVLVNTALPDGTIVKIKNASPLFLNPDQRRTPLLTMDAGTVVKVLGTQGEWYRVEFNDHYNGPRVGYVRSENVLADNGQLSPQDLSIVPRGDRLTPTDLSVPTSPRTLEPVDLSIQKQQPKKTVTEPIDLSIKNPK
jgi:hypothetical protein